jgi:hypothetical protein
VKRGGIDDMRARGIENGHRVTRAEYGPGAGEDLREFPCPSGLILAEHFGRMLFAPLPGACALPMALSMEWGAIIAIDIIRCLIATFGRPCSSDS